MGDRGLAVKKSMSSPLPGRSDADRSFLVELGSARSAVLAQAQSANDVLPIRNLQPGQDAWAYEDGEIQVLISVPPSDEENHSGFQLLGPGVFATAAMLAVADGPLPFGDLAGAVLLVGAGVGGALAISNSGRFAPGAGELAAPSEFGKISPNEAEVLFGVQPQEKPPTFDQRPSSRPREVANVTRVLTNPVSDDLRVPPHSGSPRTENLSLPYLETERSRLGGERSDKTPVEPIGKTLTAADINRIASILVEGHAFEKHLSEFNEIGINTKDELKLHLKNILQNIGLTSQEKTVNNVRYVYDVNSNTLIAFDAETGYGITTYRPTGGARHYYDLGDRKRKDGRRGQQQFRD